MIDPTSIDANTWITGGSALATLGAAIKFTRQSTITRSLLVRLSRTTVRKSQMDLWIARVESSNPGLKLPPFPRQEEPTDDTDELAQSRD